MSKFRRIMFALMVSGGLSLVVMPVGSAMAQDEGNGGLFSGLFNPGSGGSSSATPLFVKPNVKAPTGNPTTGRASATGVARVPTSNRSSSALDLATYRNLPKTARDKMSLQEKIALHGQAQIARTKASTQQRMEEAAEIAQMYREQMHERLAAQENPSAAQSMGVGGTVGMNEEQVRKMVYKKKEDTATGAKPIRLFDVR